MMLPPPAPLLQLTEEGWQQSLERALDAAPHHISTYDLQASGSCTRDKHMHQSALSALSSIVMQNAHLSTPAPAHWKCCAAFPYLASLGWLRSAGGGGHTLCPALLSWGGAAAQR